MARGVEGGAGWSCAEDEPVDDSADEAVEGSGERDEGNESDEVWCWSLLSRVGMLGVFDLFRGLLDRSASLRRTSGLEEAETDFVGVRKGSSLTIKSFVLASSSSLESES